MFFVPFQPQNILVSIPHAFQSVFSSLSSTQIPPAVPKPHLILVLQQPGISHRLENRCLFPTFMYICLSLFIIFCQFVKRLACL